MYPTMTKFAAMVVAAAAASALTACSPAPSAPADFVPATSTSAADVELVDPGFLVACVNAPFPPFEIEDKAAPTGYSGFDVEVLGAIAGRLGLTLKVNNVDFDALQSGVVLAAGQCDVGAAAITITDDRLANLDFPAPYYDSLQSLLVKADSGINDLDGTAGKTIGVQAGTTGKSYAEKHKPADTAIVEFPSDAELWAALQAGQIDALLQDQPVNHAHEVVDAGYTVVESYQTDEQYGFALAKGKAPKLLAAISEQLAAIRADGSYDALYQKYFG